MRLCKNLTAKGEATRDLILEHAYAIAARHGVEGLSIGDLASAVGMSKSGVFAHFGSREELQLALLDTVAWHFGSNVLIPALRQPRGLARLRAIFTGWLDWVRDNQDGCPIMGAVVEYDSRPGPLRDRVVGLMGQWRSDIKRAVGLAIDAGELAADADGEQIAFEIFGVAFAFHHEIRLFEAKAARSQAERAFERLIRANQSAVPVQPGAPAKAAAKAAAPSPVSQLRPRKRATAR